MATNALVAIDGDEVRIGDGSNEDIDIFSNVCRAPALQPTDCSLSDVRSVSAFVAGDSAIINRNDDEIVNILPADFVGFVVDLIAVGSFIAQLFDTANRPTREPGLSVLISRILKT